MFTSKNERIFIGLLLLIMLILYVFGLFFNVSGDAAKYAYISKEMLTTQHWFGLEIQGESYTQKPPLIFWLSALSFKLLGISNFSFKFPIFLYSLLGFWGTYQLGKSLYDKKTGILASFMIIFSTISILYTSDIHTDIVLQTNVVFALLFLFHFLKTEKLLYLFGGALMTGLCILTKGPFGAVIPFFAVAGYLLSQKKIKLLFSLKWALFLLLVIAVSLPILWPLYLENGIDGLWFFIWKNNVGRVTGSYMGTRPDPFFYFHNLAYLLLPWTIVLVAGVYYQFKKFFKKEFLAADHFLFWGTWILFILLSFSHSKLPNYIQSLVPLFFISTARGWKQIIDTKNKRWIKIQATVIYIIGALLLIVPIIFVSLNGAFYSIVLGTILLISFLSTHKLLDETKVFFQTLFLAIGIAILLNAFLLPKLFNIQAQKEAALYLNNLEQTPKNIYNYNVTNIERKESAQLKGPGERLSSFDKTPDEKHFYLNYELMFYADSYVKNIEDSTQLSELITKKDQWVFADQKGKDHLINWADNIDTLLVFDHFDIRRPARSIDISKRAIKLEQMFLIHIKNRK